MVKPLSKKFERAKFYKGYRLLWEGGQEGHWMIYDNGYNFLASADDAELGQVIEEISKED